MYSYLTTIDYTGISTYFQSNETYDYRTTYGETIASHVEYTIVSSDSYTSFSTIFPATSYYEVTFPVYSYSTASITYPDTTDTGYSYYNSTESVTITYKFSNSYFIVEEHHYPEVSSSTSTIYSQSSQTEGEYGSSFMESSLHSYGYTPVITVTTTIPIGDTIINVTTDTYAAGPPTYMTVTVTETVVGYSTFETESVNSYEYTQSYIGSASYLFPGSFNQNDYGVSIFNPVTSLDNGGTHDNIITTTTTEVSYLFPVFIITNTYNGTSYNTAASTVLSTLFYSDLTTIISIGDQERTVINVQETDYSGSILSEYTTIPRFQYQTVFVLNYEGERLWMVTNTSQVDFLSNVAVTYTGTITIDQSMFPEYTTISNTFIHLVTKMEDTSGDISESDSNTYNIYTFTYGSWFSSTLTNYATGYSSTNTIINFNNYLFVPLNTTFITVNNYSYSTTTYTFGYESETYEEFANATFLTTIIISTLLGGTYEKLLNLTSQIITISATPLLIYTTTEDTVATYIELITVAAPVDHNTHTEFTADGYTYTQDGGTTLNHSIDISANSAVISNYSIYQIMIPSPITIHRPFYVKDFVGFFEDNELEVTYPQTFTNIPFNLNDSIDTPTVYTNYVISILVGGGTIPVYYPLIYPMSEVYSSDWNFSSYGVLVGTYGAINLTSSAVNTEKISNLVSENSALYYYGYDDYNARFSGQPGKYVALATCRHPIVVTGSGTNSDYTYTYIWAGAYQETSPSTTVKFDANGVSHFSFNPLYTNYFTASALSTNCCVVISDNGGAGGTNSFIFQISGDSGTGPMDIYNSSNVFYNSYIHYYKNNVSYNYIYNNFYTYIDNYGGEIESPSVIPDYINKSIKNNILEIVGQFIPFGSNIISVELPKGLYKITQISLDISVDISGNTYIDDSDSQSYTTEISVYSSFMVDSSDITLISVEPYLTTGYGCFDIITGGSFPLYVLPFNNTYQGGYEQLFFQNVGLEFNALSYGINLFESVNIPSNTSNASTSTGCLFGYNYIPIISSTCYTVLVNTNTSDESNSDDSSGDTNFIVTSQWTFTTSFESLITSFMMPPNLFYENTNYLIPRQMPKDDGNFGAPYVFNN